MAITGVTGQTAAVETVLAAFANASSSVSAAKAAPAPASNQPALNTASLPGAIGVGIPNSRLGTAQTLAIQEETPSSGSNDGSKTDSAPSETDTGQTDSTATGTANQSADLTQSEEQLIAQLEKRDAAVRQHELAHKTAGGTYAGSASYSYQTGPDGKRYAIGGEVSIDASSVPGNPEATIRKLETVRQAALAPSDPSAQDLSVAARASTAIAAARTQANNEAAGTATSGDKGYSPSAPSTSAPSTSASSPDGNAGSITAQAAQAAFANVT